jgi:hydroxyacylglutathione hydrolase
MHYNGAMDIYTISIGAFNRYLVHDQGYILVDSGIPHTEGRVRRTLERLGVDPRQVRLILLTHGHIDHAGSARALQTLTGAPIAIHEDDQEWLQEGLVAVPQPWMAPGQQGIAALHSIWWRALQPLARRMRFPSAHAEIVIGNSGLALEEYGIRGRVLHTPGHTLGSVSLLLESGDAFVGDLGAATGRAGGQPRMPPAGNSWQQMLESWENLLAAGAKRIYPGHGPSFSAEAMRGLLVQMRQESRAG